MRLTSWVYYFGAHNTIIDDATKYIENENENPALID